MKFDFIIQWSQTTPAHSTIPGELELVGVGIPMNRGKAWNHDFMVVSPVPSPLNTFKLENFFLFLQEENPKGLSAETSRSHIFQVLRGIEFCHKNNVSFWVDKSISFVSQSFQSSWYFVCNVKNRKDCFKTDIHFNTAKSLKLLKSCFYFSGHSSRH